MKKRLLCAAIACAALLNSAQAAPILFHWKGTATVAFQQYGVEIGDVFDGTVSFDPDTANMNAPRYEIASSMGSPASITLNLGSFTQTFSAGITIANDYYGSADFYNFFGNSSLGTIDVSMYNYTGDAKTDFSLPTASLDLNAYTYRQIGINWQKVGELTAFAVPSAEADVPEPASLGLMALGLAAVGAARRRKPRA